MNILWGIGGVIVVIGIAFLLSNAKKSINLRTILIGLVIQIAFAFMVLKWDLGRWALLKLSKGVQNLTGYANEGISFLFGSLSDVDEFGSIFVIQVLTIIIFFSALISVLYYLGIMQFFIKIIGGGLSKLLGTSRAESVSAAANIFVGQTEAPLVVRPLLQR